MTRSRHLRWLRLESLESRRLLAATNLGEIFGRVILDANGNSGFDPGEGVANAAVDLYRDNGDLTFDLGDGLVAASITNADGEYAFTSLSAGDYFVVQRNQTVLGTPLVEQISPLLTVAGSEQGTIIDRFDGSGGIADTFPPEPPTTAEFSAPDAIGGQRDFSALLINGGSLDTANLVLDSGILFFGADGIGAYRITWDGIDGADLNPVGLGGIDLTEVSSTPGLGRGICLAGLRVSQPNSSLIARIFSGPNEVSEAQFGLESTMLADDLFLDFASFLPIEGNSGADLANVGAIEFTITAANEMTFGELDDVFVVGASLDSADFLNAIAFQNPSVDIETLVNDADADQPAGADVPIVNLNTVSEVTFSYVVTNTGDTPFEMVIVVDDVLGAIPSSAITDRSLNADDILDVNEQWTYTVISGATIGNYAAVGSVQAESNSIDIFVSDSDATHYVGIAPQIDIEALTNGVDADLGSDPDLPTLPVGADIVWNYVVRNTGTSDLTGVSVVDNVLGQITNIVDQGDGDLVLSSGEQWVLVATGLATEGTYQNLATVVAMASDGSTVDDSDTSNYAAFLPSINIQKSTNGLDADTFGSGPSVLVGTTVEFTYAVTNQGQFPLRAISIVDDNGTPNDSNDDFLPTFVTGDSNGNLQLDLTETWIYSASRIATVGDYFNRAVVSALDIQDNPTTDSDTSHHRGAAPQLIVRTFVNNQDADANPVEVDSDEPLTIVYVVHALSAPVFNLTLLDDNSTPGDATDDFAPPFLSGDVNQNGTLDQGESWRFQATTIAHVGLQSPTVTVVGDAIVDPQLDPLPITVASTYGYRGIDPLIVTNTSDSDSPVRGSLRYAILTANRRVGPQTVSFHIPVSDAGFRDIDAGRVDGDPQPDLFEIRIVTPLPPLRDATGPTLIDGRTQRAATGDTNDFGPEVSIRRDGPVVFDGLAITSDGNIIRDLVVAEFGTGIRIAGDENWVAGSHVVDNNDIGILVEENARDVTIGNAETADRNVITGNGQHGVVVVSNSRASIRGNSIFANGGLAIDLANDGITENDPLDADAGPNDQLNFPIVTEARRVPSHDSIVIAGRVTGAARQQQTIDLYYSTLSLSNDQRAGEFYLGATTVLTDGNGLGKFEVALAWDPLRFGLETIGSITATANSDVTSEFSLPFAVNANTIEGVAFEDADGNRSLGPNETRMVDTIVFLDGNANGQLDTGEPRVTTDANGEYFFAGLPDGNYNVMQRIDSGIAQTLPRAELVTGQMSSSVFARSITHADVDRDGNADLLLAAELEGSVVVFLNDGLGAFRRGTSIPVGDRPHVVQVADFDGDGVSDFAVTLLGPSTSTTSSRVAIWLGDGQGRFAPAGNVAVANGPVAMEVADLNGDGEQDLAVASHRAGAPQGEIAILLGDGRGNLTVAQRLATGKQPVSLAVGRMNGDLRSDLVVANFESDQVGIYLSSADGFSLATTLDVGLGPSFVDVADVNGDGRSDLAVSLYGRPDQNGQFQPDDAVQIFVATATGGFAANQTLTLPGGARAEYLRFRDIDLDLVPELFVVQSERNVLSQFRLDADVDDSQFTLDANYGVGGGSEWITIGQFTGDANLDIVASSLQGSLEVILQRSLGYQVAASGGIRVGEIDFGVLTVSGQGSPFPTAALSAIATGGHNAWNPVDVDGDGVVSPLDALLVINAFDMGVAGMQNQPPNSIYRRVLADVNGDGWVSPLDALLVINALEPTLTFTPKAAQSSAASSATSSDATLTIDRAISPASLAWGGRPDESSDKECESRTEAADAFYASLWLQVFDR